MNNSLKYGLMYGLIPGFLYLIIYAIGLNRDQSTLEYIRYGSLVVYCAVIFLGIRSEREEVLNGFIRFGKAFSTGFRMVLIGTVVATVMSYLYFGVIDTGMRDFLIVQQEQELFDRGLSPEQVDAALPQIEKFMTTPMLLIFGALSSVLIGSVITLISAAILKKEDPNEMVG
jgi:predicted secreted protein